MNSRLLLMVMLGAGCAATPFKRALEYGHSDTAKCLVVLVPDIEVSGESANALERNGFIEALHRERLSINVIAADAVRFSESSEYFFGGGAVSHLRDDILTPVRASQHSQHVWLIGISAGGFAALRTAAELEGEIDGIVAIEPFLRSPPGTIKAVERAGGLSTWQATAKAPFTNSTQFDQLWRWLKERAAKPEQSPALFVGWAIPEEPANKQTVERPLDAPVNGDALLGKALPQYRAFTVEGGHNFTSWKALFERFLKQGEFKRQCEN